MVSIMYFLVIYKNKVYLFKNNRCAYLVRDTNKNWQTEKYLLAVAFSCTGVDVTPFTTATSSTVYVTPGIKPERTWL